MANSKQVDQRGPARDGVFLYAGDGLDDVVEAEGEAQKAEERRKAGRDGGDGAAGSHVVELVVSGSRVVLALMWGSVIAMFIALNVAACGARVYVDNASLACPTDVPPDDGAPCVASADCCPPGPCYTPTCLEGQCVVVWTHDNAPCYGVAGVCHVGECALELDGGAP